MECNGIRAFVASISRIQLHSIQASLSMRKLKFRGIIMVLYRRNRVKGGTCFFTVTLRDRSSSVLVQHVAFLRQAFRKVRAERSFTMDAIVILLDHLHTVWTLPEDDADYSGRWRVIKSEFTRQLRARECP